MSRASRRYTSPSGVAMTSFGVSRIPIGGILRCDGSVADFRPPSAERGGGHVLDRATVDRIADEPGGRAGSNSDMSAIYGGVGERRPVQICPALLVWSLTLHRKGWIFVGLTVKRSVEGPRGDKRRM